MFNSSTIMFVVGYITFVCICIVIYRSYKKWLIRRYFDDTYKLLNTAVQFAYSLIYKGHILSAKLNNATLSTHELDKLRQEFLKLCRDILGPNVWSELVSIHGNDKSVELLLLLMFEDLLDKDLTSE